MELEEHTAGLCLGEVNAAHIQRVRTRGSGVLEI